jgi:hypothetical protein
MIDVLIRTYFRLQSWIDDGKAHVFVANVKCSWERKIKSNKRRRFSWNCLVKENQNATERNSARRAWPEAVHTVGTLSD